MSTDTDTSTPSDLIPARVRTALYAVGTVLELGVAPGLLAAGLTTAAAICAPIGGAFLAVAFGYRPTRGTT